MKCYLNFAVFSFFFSQLDIGLTHNAHGGASNHALVWRRSNQQCQNESSEQSTRAARSYLTMMSGSRVCVLTDGLWGYKGRGAGMHNLRSQCRIRWRAIQQINLSSSTSTTHPEPVAGPDKNTTSTCVGHGSVVHGLWCAKAALTSKEPWRTREPTDGIGFWSHRDSTKHEALEWIVSHLFTKRRL